jgi:hypothetical protein
VRRKHHNQQSNGDDVPTNLESTETST